jgi:hypothetical protein
MPLIPVTRTSVLAWFSVTTILFLAGLILFILYVGHTISGKNWRGAAVVCIALTIFIGVHPGMQARRLNLSMAIAIGADSMVAIATAGLAWLGMFIT